MRVSLARALSMDPAVLLMDEPFASLDAQTRAEMHDLLQSIWMESRKTVVFVTHNVREALVLGDRVVVMAARPGRVLRDLEVRLPRPRDPDDEMVVQLSRQIREEIKNAGTARREVVPEAAENTSEKEEGDERAMEDHRAAAGGGVGAAAPLGARL